MWHSVRKVWVDAEGREIRTGGGGVDVDITRCPTQIAIVSTGLIFHDSEERSQLLTLKFGTVVLDEAHAARRRANSGNEPNNLLDFMLHIGPRAKHVLLGTATPIQTEVRELWDLMHALSSGAEFVLGREMFSRWADCGRALPVVKGTGPVMDPREAWDWLRNPLPPGVENPLFARLRMSLGLSDHVFFIDRGIGAMDFLQQQTIDEMRQPEFLRENNPIVRHTVVRKRKALEDAGLIERVGVDVHPDRDAPARLYPGVSFEGLGLLTNHPFDVAYAAAEEYARALKGRVRGAGFVKTLLLQRICSSFASARATVERLLQRATLEDEEQAKALRDIVSGLTADEVTHLTRIADELSRPEARDPKLAAVKYFLLEHRTEGKTWLEHGCIVFSQYYDTVRAVALHLSEALPKERIAIYAGASRSGMLVNQAFAPMTREEIKEAVRRHEIRLIVATDAASTGLNLQTLGTLINVDLPWNPSRLEQRLGRIKRIGQVRKSVDMLNLVYHGTLDEEIYEVLSRRMKDRFDLFGDVPDVIADTWIDDMEELRRQMDQYIHLRNQARNAFEPRVRERRGTSEDGWERCSRVLSRKDVVEKLATGW
jgi:superfamily II DNA or RNA helicase